MSPVPLAAYARGEFFVAHEALEHEALEVDLPAILTDIDVRLEQPDRAHIAPIIRRTVPA